MFSQRIVNNKEVIWSSAGSNLDRKRSEWYVNHRGAYEAYKDVLQSTVICRGGYNGVGVCDDLSDSFFFLDPPYRNTSGYKSESDSGCFNDQQTTELISYALELQRRGVIVWIANKDYDDGFFEHQIKDRGNIYKIPHDHHGGSKSIKATETLIVLKP